MTPHPLFTLSTHAACEDVRTLFIRDMVCEAAIGVHAHEQGRRQKIVVDLAAQVANPARPLDDDFSKVLDYGFLRHAVLEATRGEHVRLTETVCETIAELCLAAPTVLAVYVRVGKLEAFDDCQAIGCELLRQRARRELTAAPAARADALSV